MKNTTIHEPTAEELDAMIEKAKREILAREAEERYRKARAYLKQKQEQSS